jgi:hypothetical protein
VVGRGTPRVETAQAALGTDFIIAGMARLPPSISSLTSFRDIDAAAAKMFASGPKLQVAIQMGIEPSPSRRKGRISHLYVYRQQIDERQCLNLNGG